ncbi:glycosyltransferase family 39 protein, partial [Flavobacteriaceae bacterium]|nr:glycosyltransferase family 39 protein [Flavobacteriaceae bacterium]
MKKIRDFGILLSVFLIQILISIKNLDLNYLWFINIDEWAFHGSMLRIFQGVSSFDLRIFYGTGFFNYGHLYFLINSFFSYPFYLINNNEGLVLVPRLLSSVSSIITIFYIYKIFKHEGEKYLFPLILILSFPSFWINSTIFHPDWPYTCCVIISIYYLSKDNWRFGSNFKISCFFFAVSFSLKIQSITFIPIYLFYILFSKNTAIEILKHGLFIFVTIVGLRIVTNPYL